MIVGRYHGDMPKPIIFVFLSFFSLALGCTHAPVKHPTSTGTSAPSSAPTYTRQQDIVYGRSYGAALTFDIFRPTGKANGAGVIFVVSGGWVSTPELMGTPVSMDHC